MSQQTLQERWFAAGARMGEYGGGTTPTAFGDVAAEFRALTSTAGVFDLSWRTKFAVTGDDRARWLNGMISNNVRDLPLGRGVYGFVLDPQGHIHGDLYAYQRGECLLLDTEAAQASTLRAWLERYIIMDDVELTDLAGKLTAIGVIGPQCHDAMRRAGLLDRELAPLELQDVTYRAGEREIGVTVVRSDWAPAAYEIWLSPDAAPVAWGALVSAGAQPVGSEALELLRIAEARPRVGIDIGPHHLPQETAQDRALHFQKGCYIGQEIVERIRSRGQVHRRFVQFEIEGEPPARGTKIIGSDKEVGVVTSAARVPFATGAKTLALGYVRREAMHSALTVGGTAAKLTIPQNNVQEAPALTNSHG